MRPLPDMLGPLPSSEEGEEQDMPSAGLFPCTQQGVRCSPSTNPHRSQAQTGPG